MAQSFESMITPPDRPSRVHKARPLPNISALPDEALLCPEQMAPLSGFTVHAFKKWRREKKGQGPRVIYVEGRPRTSVRDFRAWIGAAA